MRKLWRNYMARHIIPPQKSQKSGFFCQKKVWKTGNGLFWTKKWKIFFIQKKAIAGLSDFFFVKNATFLTKKKSERPAMAFFGRNLPPQKISFVRKSQILALANLFKFRFFAKKDQKKAFSPIKKQSCGEALKIDFFRFFLVFEKTTFWTFLSPYRPQI